jgi:hypothetical protein
MNYANQLKGVFERVGEIIVNREDFQEEIENR